MTEITHDVEQTLLKCQNVHDSRHYINFKNLPSHFRINIFILSQKQKPTTLSKILLYHILDNQRHNLWTQLIWKQVNIKYLQTSFWLHTLYYIFVKFYIFPFAAKLKERYRNFPYSLCLYMQNLYLKPIVYITVHSYTHFIGLDKCVQTWIHQYKFMQSIFITLNLLCFTYLSPSTPPLVTTALFYFLQSFAFSSILYSRTQAVCSGLAFPQ